MYGRHGTTQDIASLLLSSLRRVHPALHTIQLVDNQNVPAMQSAELPPGGRE